MTRPTHRGTVKRVGDRFVFDGESDETRWSFPDPRSVALDEARHRARYSLSVLTQADAFRLLTVVEAYVHLTTHQVGTENAVAKLRRIRRAVGLP